MEKLTIKLKCRDNQIFDVEEGVARLSQKLSEMLDAKSISNEEAIPIDNPHITGDILGRVIQWCIYHQADEDLDEYETESEDDFDQWTMQAQRNNKLLFQRRRKPSKPLPKWDRKFFAAADNSTLYGIIICTHYLKIKKLRNIACSEVAHRLNNMNAQELRAEFSGFEKVKVVEDDDEIQLECIDTSRRG